MRAFRSIVCSAFVFCLIVLTSCGSSTSVSGFTNFPGPTSPTSGGASPTPTPTPVGTTGGGSGAGNTGSGAGTNTPSTSQRASIVYVSGTSEMFGNNSVQTTGFLDVRTLDPNSGALTPVQGSPFTVNYAGAGDMALSPDGAHAYVIAEGTVGGSFVDSPSFLLVYSLDPNSGAPTLLQTLAAANPNAPGPSNVTVHPSGRFVYLSNDYQDNINNNGIGIFSVQSDGTLVFSGLGGIVQPQFSYGAVIDPSGNFLFTASDGLPVGNLQNLACGLFNSNVYAFHIDSASGALTPVTGSPFTFQRNICEVGVAPQWLTLQIDSSGQHLFLADSGNRTVTVFSIDSSTGALTLLPGSTVDTGAGPSFDASAIDPQSDFLYVGGASYSFTGFSFSPNQSTSDLAMLPGMPVQEILSQVSNAGSRYMAVDPSGTFLFGNENEYTSAFSCCDPDQLVEFRIDPSTGALTAMPSATVTLAGTVSKIVVAPAH